MEMTMVKRNTSVQVAHGKCTNSDKLCDKTTRLDELGFSYMEWWAGPPCMMICVSRISGKNAVKLVVRLCKMTRESIRVIVLIEFDYLNGVQASIQWTWILHWRANSKTKDNVEWKWRVVMTLGGTRFWVQHQNKTQTNNCRCVQNVRVRLEGLGSSFETQPIA